MHNFLHDLQKKQLVWKAAAIEQNKERLSTGHKTLDQALNGGFPKAGLIHVKSLIGVGELRLVLPAIKDKIKEQLSAFIAAPFLLNAEFLLSQGIDLDKVVDITTDKHTTEQKLWSAEQCAKSGACAAVFIWHEKLQHTQAKKLELAALKGQSLVFLFEANRRAQANLPVSLAMSLKRDESSTDNLSIQVDKQKVGWPIPSFSVKLPFKAKIGSPMHRRHRPRSHAVNCVTHQTPIASVNNGMRAARM